MRLSLHARWLVILSALPPSTMAATRGVRAIPSTKKFSSSNVRRLGMMDNTKELNYIGENKRSYGECEGDCDSSNDCDVSILIEYDYSSSFTPLPPLT
jgi:hypothetical protein